MIRFPGKVIRLVRVMRSGKTARSDLAVWLWPRKALLLANSTYEMALLASSTADERLKLLAGLKASTMIGCPF